VGGYCDILVVLLAMFLVFSFQMNFVFKVFLRYFTFLDIKQFYQKSYLRNSRVAYFIALGNLDTEVDINRAWETITENIKVSARDSLGYHELKKHKPWFDEGCSK
jgi:hypothetical protein